MKYSTRLRYIVANLGLVILMYYGMYIGIELANIIALMLLWTTAIVGTGMLIVSLYIDNQTRLSFTKTDFPFWVDTIFDFCVLVVIIYYGHIGLGIFYFLQMIALLLISHNDKRIST